MTGTSRRLYRSRTDRMIGGVCAGLGEYLNIDPTLIRLLVALAAIFAWPGLIIVYLIMMLIVPESPT